MPNKDWYVYIVGETFGPITTNGVKVMLKQYRLHFVDFIWCEGFTKWVRVSDVDDFAHDLPSYPEIPIPASREDTGEEHDRSEQKAKITKQGRNAAGSHAHPPEHKASHKNAAKPPAPAPTPAPLPAPAAATAEERKWPKARRHVRVEIKGWLESPAYGKLDVFNISEGGLFIEGKIKPEVGAELKFLLHSDQFEKPLDMTGVVIRHGWAEGGGEGFAIEFTRVNPAHKRLIAEYVTRTRQVD